MGWVMMSERELNRVDVLAQVDDGRLSVDNAANMLDLTRRQIFRLLKRYRTEGASAIRHQSARLINPATFEVSGSLSLATGAPAVTFLNGLYNR
jgi:hypothetical protein